MVGRSWQGFRQQRCILVQAFCSDRYIIQNRVSKFQNFIWKLIAKRSVKNTPFWLIILLNVFNYLPPWSIKFNKEEFVVLEFLIEVLISEYEDSFFLCDFFTED